jgi:hypothetical protein
MKNKPKKKYIMKKKVKNLKEGDKIEMADNTIKTVKNVLIDGLNSAIYYNEGGFSYAFSNEEIHLYNGAAGKNYTNGY